MVLGQRQLKGCLSNTFILWTANLRPKEKQEILVLSGYLEPRPPAPGQGPPSPCALFLVRIPSYSGHLLNSATHHKGNSNPRSLTEFRSQGRRAQSRVSGSETGSQETHLPHIVEVASINSSQKTGAGIPTLWLTHCMTLDELTSFLWSSSLNEIIVSTS